jgi:hypothetical protein
MIKRYFILFTLAACTGLVACQNHTPATAVKASAAADPDKKKSQGKLEFTKEMHNFGTVKEGETVAYSFQFKNNGATPFRLTKVEPTCGCLTVQYNKDEIGNQAASAIEVIFHSEGEWGNQIKTVNIETSNGETKTLTIGAFVENKNFNPDLNK